MTVSLWPNQEPIPDGIVPVEEVSQDPKFLDDDEDDLEMELADR